LKLLDRPGRLRRAGRFGIFAAARAPWLLGVRRSRAAARIVATRIIATVVGISMLFGAATLRFAALRCGGAAS
jgi:hypothetical protein